jgi:hypothetical protein
MNRVQYPQFRRDFRGEDGFSLRISDIDIGELVMTSRVTPLRVELTLPPQNVSLSKLF